MGFVLMESVALAVALIRAPDRSQQVRTIDRLFSRVVRDPRRDRFVQLIELPPVHLGIVRSVVRIRRFWIGKVNLRGFYEIGENIFIQSSVPCDNPPRGLCSLTASRRGSDNPLRRKKFGNAVLRDKLRRMLVRGRWAISRKL